MKKEKIEEKIKTIEKKIECKIAQILKKDEINHEDYMILTGEIGRYKNKIYEEDSKVKREEYMNAMSKMMSAI